MKVLLELGTTITQILSNLIEHYSPGLQKGSPNHPGRPLHLPLLPHPLLLPHSPLLPPVPQPASLPTLVQPVKHAGHRGAEVHHRELSSQLPLNYSLFHLCLMASHPSPPLHHGCPAAGHRVLYLPTTTVIRSPKRSSWRRTRPPPPSPSKASILSAFL